MENCDGDIGRMENWDEDTKNRELKWVNDAKNGELVRRYKKNGELRWR